jgi:hypothetical protein
MNLSRRQQKILDQIEQALQAADPHLKSMFASFGRSAGEAGERERAVPAAGDLSGRPSRRTLTIFTIVVVCLLGVLVVGIRSTSRDCPGLSSDQVVASATVRYAGCDQNTDAWSRGGR